MEITQLLDGEYDHAYIFILQAKNPEGQELVEGQIEAAMGASKAALQLTGAEVALTLTSAPLSPVPEGKIGRLVVTTTQETIDA